MQHFFQRYSDSIAVCLRFCIHRLPSYSSSAGLSDMNPPEDVSVLPLPNCSILQIKRMTSFSSVLEFWKLDALFENTKKMWLFLMLFSPQGGHYINAFSFLHSTYCFDGRFEISGRYNSVTQDTSLKNSSYGIIVMP